MNLQQQLEELAGPEQMPSMDTVGADLARGRRARRKRRTVQQVAGSALAIAAIAVGASVYTVNSSNHTPAGAESGQGQRTSKTKLVAYDGAQPKAYTIDTIPEGFTIKKENAYNLVLVPSENANEELKNSGGNILISLNSKDVESPPGGKTVTVNGQQAIMQTHSEKDLDPATREFMKSEERRAVANGTASFAPVPPGAELDESKTLWINQKSGVYLLIQFSAGLGLSENDMITIGAGVHVHKGAEQGVG
ncbi:hypothetical protein [Actinoplanes sp. NPDC051859]|uniref:hypothetical protein n=1 Tax=Actinoplanes sp. NPDC051859 TaxID=3363909 RepID=UPI00378E6DBC